jgi:peptidoglycan/LPS O-acetylase OafA/YrhL
MPPATSKPARLPLPDLLRGLAAMAVMLHHEAPLYGSPGLFPRAYLAVDFFFMLSGFVLTLAFEPRLNATLSATRFMAQRAARLWPILAVGVSIAAAARLATGAPFSTLAAPLLASLLFLPWPQGRGGLFRLDGPQWSISYELIGNLAHALLLRRLSDRALLGLVMACAGLLIWRAQAWGSIGLGDQTTNWPGGLPRLGFSYGLGVWLGRAFALPHAAPRMLWPAALLPFAMITAPFWPLSTAAGDLVAVIILFPPALWSAAHVRKGPHAARLSDALGRLSYPLYAIHGPLLIASAPFLRHHLALRPLALLAIVALAALITLTPLMRGLPLPKTPDGKA